MCISLGRKVIGLLNAKMLNYCPVIHHNTTRINWLGLGWTAVVTRRQLVKHSIRFLICWIYIHLLLFITTTTVVAVNSRNERFLPKGSFWMSQNNDIIAALAAFISEFWPHIASLTLRWRHGGGSSSSSSWRSCRWIIEKKPLPPSNRRLGGQKNIIAIPFLIKRRCFLWLLFTS